MGNWCEGCSLAEVHLDETRIYFPDCYKPQPIDQEVVEDIQFEAQLEQIKKSMDLMKRMGGWRSGFETEKEKEAGGVQDSHK